MDLCGPRCVDDEEAAEPGAVHCPGSGSERFEASGSLCLSTRQICTAPPFSNNLSYLQSLKSKVFQLRLYSFSLMINSAFF